MTFLPIVERELRVASRRRSTYLGRLGGAVVAMGVGGWIMIAAHNEAPGELGQALFISLSVMMFIYSVAAGGRITADCLSEEKREGTLGLLFLTDLKGYDIVAGKLVANSLNTFYGLLAAFPVLAIPLLMGGVSSGEFWRVSLVATNLLFFSLAIGMFTSAICRDERKAMSLAFLLILFILAATPLVELGLNIADHNRPGTTVWLMPSPAFACFTAFGSRLGFKAQDFWPTVLMTHVYGWLFLALASAIVPRSWQDKAVRNPIRLRGFWKLLFSTNKKAETARRAHLLEINPFLWLAARDPVKTIFLWAVLFVLTVAWIWGCAKWPKEWFSIPTYIITALLLHTLLKFWVASEACYRFVQDRKSGAFELMLSTPLSVEEILRGQRLALFRQFGGPVMFVLAVDFLFLILGLADRDMHRSDGRSFWVMLWIVGMFVFVMDLFALSWVSMWGGLSSKQVNRASTSAIAKILVMPWMAFFFSMTLVGVAGVFSKFNPDEHGILLYWFALSVLTNLVFMFWSKENLRTRLREMATQRFAPKSKGFWWSKSREEKAEQEVPPVIFTT
jgi:ABC-type transport system involved in multi-copper enzyme maturation permease subunit